MNAKDELQELLVLLVDWEREAEFFSFARTSKETLELILEQHRMFRQKYGRLGFIADEGTLNCCLSYAGDEYDNTIRMILGHHPSCQKFETIIPNYEYKKNFCHVLEALDKKDDIAKDRLEAVTRCIVDVYVTDGNYSRTRNENTN